MDYIDDKVCSLLIDSNRIRGAVAESGLQKALQTYFGKPIGLSFKSQTTALNTPAAQQQKAQQDRQQAAIDSINTDETVLALKKNFDAQVITHSIEPI